MARVAKVRYFHLKPMENRVVSIFRVAKVMYKLYFSLYT